MAVRVTYCLGLHFSAVEIGLVGKDTAFPIEINPFPNLTPKMHRTLEKAVSLREERMNDLRHPERTVVLGADPEFIMRRRRGGIIYASRYFPFKGPVGSDEQGSYRRRGVRPIAEIRPRPTDDPEILVWRIRALLRNAMRRSPRRNVRWQAGNAPFRSYPIGGHIHFSRVSLTTEFLRALDNYLALFIAMIEDPVRARARRPKYGYLGDFRWMRHGGFEYRTPASWIVSAEISLAVLHLARLIALNYEHLPKNIFSAPEVSQLYYQANQEGLRKYFFDAWRDVRSLPDYQRNATYIDVIYELVNDGRTWEERQDLRFRWGLIRSRRRRTRRSR